jgi:hypothetical protein
MTGIYQKLRQNLDLITLASNISNAVFSIDTGRKGFATKGKAEEGRVSYESGIAEAMTSFQEAQITADPQTIILAEYTFVTQELQLCEKSDSHAIKSLTAAIQNFDDAFLTLQIVENKTLYQGAEKTYSHDKNHRIKEGYPLDAFHVACRAHKTRLQNVLKATGVDPIEKALLKQRLSNLSTAQQGYVEKQKRALGD